MKALKQSKKSLKSVNQPKLKYKSIRNGLAIWIVQLKFCKPTQKKGQELEGKLDYLYHQNFFPIC